MRRWRRLTIRTHTHGPVTVVALTGVIDSTTASRLAGRLDKLLAAGHHRLVVDLHAVTACEIQGIDVLLTVGSRLQEHNRRLHLVLPDEQLGRLLKSTGHTDLFVIHPTMNDAITAAGTDQAGGS